MRSVYSRLMSHRQHGMLRDVAAAAAAMAGLVTVAVVTVVVAAAATAAAVAVVAAVAMAAVAMAAVSEMAISISSRLRSRSGVRQRRHPWSEPAAFEPEIAPAVV
mgnify:CR=1 FL=1